MICSAVERQRARGRSVGDGLEVGEVVGVCEGGENDDFGTYQSRILVFVRASYKVGADETGAAGDENLHVMVPICSMYLGGLRSCSSVFDWGDGSSCFQISGLR